MHQHPIDIKVQLCDLLYFPIKAGCLSSCMQIQWRKTFNVDIMDV